MRLCRRQKLKKNQSTESAEECDVKPMGTTMAWSGQRFSDFRNDPTPNARSTFQPRNNTNMQLNAGPVKMENLNVGTTANVVGVVIAKEGPKSIFSRKNNGTERFLFSFVIRDSPRHFVNCTCWGKEHFITETNGQFCIGDVVSITNAQVQPKPSDGSDEKFRVSTPVPYQLSLSENHSTISLYNGMDLGYYAPLQYIPIKASSDYYTLEDVLANGEGLSGDHINLLAAIRQVCPGKDITTKNGKHTKRCEVRLFDESCNNFSLILWGAELVNFAQTWIPIDTVVFAADVRMNYDNFKSSMVAVADSKTVFTLNPDTVDARCLCQFAQTQQFPSDGESGGASRMQEDPPLDQITDVVTVKQLQMREGLTSDYAVVHGVLTLFDLDAENTDQFFKRKCSKCKQPVYQNTGYRCTNTDCSQGALSVFNLTGEVTTSEPELNFSMSVSITDHTGTVQVRLAEQQIEAFTGWNVNKLMQLNVSSRTDMKWAFLMERCKFYIKVTKSFKEPGQNFYRLLSCSKTGATDVHQQLSTVKGR